MVSTEVTPPLVVRGTPRTTDTRAARLALWGVVVAAAGVLVFENRNMWFGGDEWFVITDRGLTNGPGHQGALEPFNEHWATIPILAFRALYSVVGVTTYWPYVALVIVAHLAVVVLLWHLMIRACIDAWVATCACAVLAVLGTGSENLLTAWQVTFVAALAFGLGALVVVPASGGLSGRDGIAAGLLTVAVMNSGVALPLLVVFGLVTLVTRGWRVASGTLAVPVVIYAAWFVAFGRDADEIADPAPRRVPEFVWNGVTDALGDVARLPALGTIVVLAVCAWLAWKVTRRPLDRNLTIPVALAIGGVLFLASTGWRRANLFGADPAASRYAYVTVALVLPLVAMAAQGLLRGDALRRALLAFVTIALVLGQFRLLDHDAEIAEPAKRSERGAVLATAALAREGRPFLLARPLHPFEPQVTVDEIVGMDRDGKLRPLDGATLRDRLTVLARLNLFIGPDRIVPADANAMVEVARDTPS